MTSSFAVADLSSRQSPTEAGSLERRIFFLLACVALAYAFFAGLRTVQDFDLGWQMATGRWVVEHHRVPSVDVLSYTMAGQPWMYPVGSGVLFFLAYQLGGFGLISWMGAAACVGTIALLLRRGSATTAGIAVLAVPLIAMRTMPRADMFTVVLFAAFVSLLWENYQTGAARLWLLPLLMVAWVNLHFGFASGLVLVAAYGAAEGFECLLGQVRRAAAVERLRRCWMWLGLTVVATLANPWGWNIYRGLLIEQRAFREGRLWINEWAPIPITWATLSRSLLVRHTGVTIYWLLAVAIVAGGAALYRGRWAAAILLLGSTYPATQAIRMGAVFACVVTVVGGAELWPLLTMAAQRIPATRVRTSLAMATVVLLAVLAGLRSFDLVTNRHYYATDDEATFGAGLCTWLPSRVADFIRRENLPGEVFNTYGAGGYFAWSLGPERRVYIDGRDTMYGSTMLARHAELVWNSPDSPAWQQETSRYGINTVALAVGRRDAIPSSLLRDFCSSKQWRPVYLDERSSVFVRNTPENAPVIQRLQIDCATAPLPRPPISDKRGDAFNTWANTAMTLYTLNRNAEAQSAFEKAIAIDPNAAFVHRYYADLLFAIGNLEESEQQYWKAIALDPSQDNWAALARTYMKRGRLPAAADALEHEARVAPRPYLVWQDLAYLYLQLQEPGDALRAFDAAARNTPSALKAADNGFFEFKIAQGRAAAWEALGDFDRATAYQKEAANLQPNVAAPWRRLASFYERQGRSDEAARARAHATAVEAQHHP